MSPQIIQFILLGVGLWLCGTLTGVGYLILKNVIMQKHVLKNMDFYLSRQTKQLDYVCMLNGTMVKSLNQTRAKIDSLETELKKVYGLPHDALIRGLERGRMHG